MAKQDKQKPWLTEPDQIEFQYRGYQCLIRRNPELKILCGYVAIPKDSKFYNVNDYDAICDSLQVWGGITFAGKINKTDSKFYLGFDCAHLEDYVPGIDGLPQCAINEVKNYKDIVFVKTELQHLVEQIIAQDKK